MVCARGKRERGGGKTVREKDRRRKGEGHGQKQREKLIISFESRIIYLKYIFF